MDAVIGALRVVLGMDSAALEKGWDRAAAKNREGARGMKAVGEQISEVGKNIKDSITGAVEGAASRVPILGDALVGLGGPAGIAAGVLAGVAIAASSAKAAMDWADEMQASADHIGITVESLQSLGYAADEADVDVADLKSGMESLNGALGAMLTGVGDAKLKKAFEAIGIDRDDLRGMKDASDLLPLIAERLSGLGSQAEQVQIARKLGIEALLPMLQDGSAGLAKMTGEASKLGLVISNETTASLADLHRKTELASQRIDTQLRLAFIQLAPAIADGTAALADFLQKVNEFDKWQMAHQKILFRKMASENYDGFVDGQMYEGGAVGAGRGRKGGFVTGRDHTPKVYSEDKEEESAADRAAKRLQAEMAAAKRKAESDASAIKSQINSMIASYATPDEAADLKHAKDMATLTTKYQAEVAELEALKKAGKVTDAEFEKKWSDIHDEYEDLKRRIDETRAKGYDIDKITPLKAVKLGQPDLDTSPYTVEQREYAQRLKDNLKAAWADIGYAAKNVMRDVIEDGKVNWRSLASYIIDNWQSVLAVIKDVWKQAQAGGANGGGLWGMISGGLSALIGNIPGFADGVNNFGGGLAIVGERGPELVNLPRGASVIPNNAMGGFAAGMAGMALAISVTPSPLFDVHIERTVMPMAQQAAAAGAAGGSQLAQLDRARDSRTTIPEY